MNKHAAPSELVFSTAREDQSAKVSSLSLAYPGLDADEVTEGEVSEGF